MSKIKKKVALVIPYYKKDISPDEKISIKHLNKFLKAYDKFLILPANLKDTSFTISHAKIMYFPSEFFTSVQKYSELLTTKSFYQKFSDYEYILIYQLDALIFSDQLSYWCKKGYDFIGSPFFNPIIGFLSHKRNYFISGGNGGFSLRKVSSFIKVIDNAEKLASRKSKKNWIRILWFILGILTNKSHRIWLKASPQEYPFNEDGFWSFEAPKYYPQFKIAPFHEALKFSFEKKPRTSFKLNNNQLPFGCHAWAKYDRDFWKPFLLP